MNSKERILQWARPEIVALKPYQSARQEFVNEGREMILLDANENPFNSEVNRYPDPLQGKLKKRLAEAKGLESDQIYLGNGSDEVLNQLMIAFCQPAKDKALLLPPTFGMYQVCADINGVETIASSFDQRFSVGCCRNLKGTGQAHQNDFYSQSKQPHGELFRPGRYYRDFRGF